MKVCMIMYTYKVLKTYMNDIHYKQLQTIKNNLQIMKPFFTFTVITYINN